MRHGVVELSGGGSAVLADAERHHAGKIWALREQVLAEGQWFLSYPDEVDDPLGRLVREVAEHASDAGSLYLLARSEGRLMGVLTLTRPRLRRLQHIAWLELYLAPEARGQGLGSAMMAAALEWAVSNPVLTKLSLAVMADNEVAVGLYRSLGFEVEGHRKGEIQEDDGRLRDDLLMALRVG